MISRNHIGAAAIIIYPQIFTSARDWKLRVEIGRRVKEEWEGVYHTYYTQSQTHSCMAIKISSQVLWLSASQRTVLIAILVEAINQISPWSCHGNQWFFPQLDQHIVRDFYVYSAFPWIPPVVFCYRL